MLPHARAELHAELVGGRVARVHRAGQRGGSPDRARAGRGRCHRVEHHVHPVVDLVAVLTRERAAGGVAEHTVRPVLPVGEATKRPVVHARREVACVERVAPDRGVVGGDVSDAGRHRHRDRQGLLLPPLRRLVLEGHGGQQGPGARPQVADVRSRVGEALVEPEGLDVAVGERPELDPDLDRAIVERVRVRRGRRRIAPDPAGAGRWRWRGECPGVVAGQGVPGEIRDPAHTPLDRNRVGRPVGQRARGVQRGLPRRPVVAHGAWHHGRTLAQLERAPGDRRRV